MPRSKIATDIYEKHLPQKVLTERAKVQNDILLDNVFWLLKRRSEGMKQYELADKLGIQKSTLSNKLKGYTFFTAEELFKIALIFGVQVEDLFKK